jgi:undecaprenyl diphosphate synthase
LGHQQIADGRRADPQPQSYESERASWPRNVLVVNDGNGRWARERGLPVSEGHRAGVRAQFQLVRNAVDLGIEQLTCYAFSTENWSRPTDEVECLMNLIAQYLDAQTMEAAELGVRIKHLGRRDRMPSHALDAIDRAERATANNTGMSLFIALDYGGRQELLDAAERYSGGGEEEFKRLLYAPEQRDPDLAIRTGGNQRLSGSLPWHLVYTELLFLDIYWPDFRRVHLEWAMHEYTRRTRTFGTRAWSQSVGVMAEAS